MSQAAITFDEGEAINHCKVMQNLLSQERLPVDELGADLARSKKRLRATVSKACKGLPAETSAKVLSFARTVDIMLIRGLCEVAICKKYPGYAEESLRLARVYAGFVHGGMEVLDHQMFLGS